MMERNQKEFSAKLMLFGEYSILLGSSALSIPLTTFHGRLKIPAVPGQEYSNRYSDSNRVLWKLCDHYISKSRIFSGFLDLDHFRGDVRDGMYFDSDIPQQYGVGSSGALCAAIYTDYAFEPLVPDTETGNSDILKLKHHFSRMESFFHGKSSGFDPLVIYLRHPMRIQDHHPGFLSFQIDFLERSGGVFLLDTGGSSGTAPLVKTFLEQYAPGGAINNAGKELCRLNNACINNLVENNAGNFWENLEALSLFQLHGLSGMIPGPMHTIWSQIMEEGLFYLKLCGSGGGGFLTGFTADFSGTIDYFKQHQLKIVPVNIQSDQGTGRNVL